MEHLYEMKKEMEGYAGAWNGKEPGRQEDKAMWAREVIEILDELIEKLKEEI